MQNYKKQITIQKNEIYVKLFNISCKILQVLLK